MKKQFQFTIHCPGATLDVVGMANNIAVSRDYLTTRELDVRMGIATAQTIMSAWDVHRRAKARAKTRRYRAKLRAAATRVLAPQDVQR